MDIQTQLQPSAAQLRQRLSGHSLQDCEHRHDLPSFVPADSERKLAKAKSSPADALILDLEDAVAAERRPHAAQALMREYVRSRKREAAASLLWVRVNPVRQRRIASDDLESVVSARTCRALSCRNPIRPMPCANWIAICRRLRRRMERPIAASG